MAKTRAKKTTVQPKKSRTATRSTVQKTRARMKAADLEDQVRPELSETPQEPMGTDDPSVPVWDKDPPLEGVDAQIMESTRIQQATKTLKYTPPTEEDMSQEMETFSLDIAPTPPKPGDPPKFRRAFNNYLVDGKIPPHQYPTAEPMFLQRWEIQVIAQSGSENPVRVIVSKGTTGPSRVGNYRFKRPLKPGEEIVIPAYVALHLKESGYVSILGKA